MEQLTTAEVFAFIDTHTALTDAQFLCEFEREFNAGLSLLECSNLISWRRGK